MTNMKVLILLSVIFTTALAEVCRPRFHYWRPYNGTMPRDAFEAGLDDDGRKNYIAKIIPLDKYLWTIPAQIKECEHHIDFGWCCGTQADMKINRFIEILCTDTPEKLTWHPVNASPGKCCFVEAGVGLEEEKHVLTVNVGKIVIKGLNFIGRVYQNPGFTAVQYVDNNKLTTKKTEGYNVLAYDC